MGDADGDCGTIKLDAIKHYPFGDRHENPLDPKLSLSFDQEDSSEGREQRGSLSNLRKWLMKQKQRRSTFLLRRKKYFAKAIGIIEELYMIEGRCLFDSDSVDYDEYSYESSDSQGDGSTKSSNRTTLSSAVSAQQNSSALSEEKPTKGFFRRFFSGKKAWFKWNLGVVVATFGAIYHVLSPSQSKDISEGSGSTASWCGGIVGSLAAVFGGYKLYNYFAKSKKHAESPSPLAEAKCVKPFNREQRVQNSCSGRFRIACGLVLLVGILVALCWCRSSDSLEPEQRPLSFAKRVSRHSVSDMA